MGAPIMKKFISAVLVLALLPSAALAWGKMGHATVADIAEAQLTPKALATVRQLLASDGDQHLNQVSSWADEMKKERREYGEAGIAGKVSHTIRLPLDHSGYSPNLCPSQFCAVAVINYYDKILADRSATMPQREEALKFVVHLVGDVHQPLHASAVTGGQIQVLFDGQQYTLHRVWDSMIIKQEAGDNDELLARRLMATEHGLYFGGDPASWALEGRDIARDQIYGAVPQHTDQVLQLPPDYADRNWPIVEARLTQAGIRLGALLNAALN